MHGIACSHCAFAPWTLPLALHAATARSRRDAPAGRGWAVAEGGRREEQKQIAWGRAKKKDNGNGKSNSNSKDNGNGNGKSRFPAGMTTRKTTATAKATATATATATAKTTAKADSLRE